jgi:hypothetical protein
MLLKMNFFIGGALQMKREERLITSTLEFIENY